jgi:3-oxoacyl-[acyl-carrier protein] reductase/meso-butanediol dehydrogenase/(S,S)-butanediol dehydrogenase/diacetyl reductase
MSTEAVADGLEGVEEMGPLSGKVAIVTGAGRYRSIGRQIALALAQEGADVVVTGSGRPPESYPEEEKAIGWRDVESVAEEVRSLGCRALPLVVDVTRAQDVQSLVDRTLSELGRVDILVNNAAASRGRDRVPVVELAEEDWRRVMEVNLTGTFLVTRAVARALIDQGQGGCIVNVSSVAGRLALPAYAAYGTSKAGLIHFTRILARELAPYRIRVNCVCPGLVDTYRMADVTRGPGRESWLASIPLGREAQPEEVGRLVAFLCGPDASFITGDVVTIDGGRTLVC